MTNAGGSSTRGLSYDLTLKRDVDAIHASNGTQQPREVFSGVLDADINCRLRSAAPTGNQTPPHLRTA